MREPMQALGDGRYKRSAINPLAVREIPTIHRGPTHLERKDVPHMFERIKEKRNEEGFTLIELLIVIIILAILAAIVVFAVGTTTTNSKVSACNADAKSVETAVEAFKAQTTSWPTSLGELTTTSIYNSQTVGPWLRSTPGSGNGYTIAIDSSGNVSVNGTNFDSATNPCSSVS